MIRYLCNGLAIFGITLLLIAAPQSAPSEAERLLDLRRAELNERQVASSLEQQRHLYAEGLISNVELRRAEGEAERARLDTQRARIVLANELPSFRIVSAIKLAGQNGGAEVVLTLQELEHGYGEALQRGYLVSLTSGGVVVSEPYQSQVTLDGKGGRIIRLRFRLLKETDEVSVLVASGTRHEELPIVLQRDRSNNRLEMASSNSSQEGALGGKVEYPMQIDRFASSARSATLVTEGLPPVFASEWIDAKTNAKLTSIQFPDNQNIATVILRVFLPVDGDATWLGKTISFRSVAFESINGQRVTVGSANLELRPIGSPKLILTTDNPLTTLAPGEEKTITLQLQNLGGAPAHDVLFEINPPVGVDVRPEPAIVPLLGPREITNVKMRLSAAMDIVAAEYNVRVQARAQTRLANVDSPDLSLRLEIKTSVISVATISTALIVLSAAIAVVVWGVRAIKH